jgi:hypothetical protein
MTFGDGELNLPYEDVPDGPIEIMLPDSTVVCGGLGFRSAMAAHPTMPGEMVPVIVFDFWTAEGGQLPPVALVLPLDAALALPEEIRKAVRAAVRGARKGPARG